MLYILGIFVGLFLFLLTISLFLSVTPFGKQLFSRLNKSFDKSMYDSIPSNFAREYIESHQSVLISLGGIKKYDSSFREGSFIKEGKSYKARFIIEVEGKNGNNGLINISLNGSDKVNWHITSFDLNIIN